MAIRLGAGRINLFIFCLLGASLVAAEPAARSTLAMIEDLPPRIVLIIDDLGHMSRAGKRATSLPGPVACAVLPLTPFAVQIAEQAYIAGKEVMLHLPLAPIQHDAIAAGTIFIDTTRKQLARIFAVDIASIPHVVGVNNHMGSMLTQHPGHMAWIMNEIRQRDGLFFVDSYTSEASVALRIATEKGIPATRRDVFLDNVPTEAAIDREFRRLKQLARRNGVAVGIGHPYPATLTYLERILPELSSEGIQLISVAESIRYRASLANMSAASH
ncbi:MAG: divergent polysaccharide deacetylase family protein [Gammaproteobacteria bacterium]|jgi:hypothetical protein|nr:hypothetical protein [Chromatiales bacterium]MDP6675239.1 divergent polysaccharide deacetylase family protein [Gammaproteobacteria bacterium]